MRTLRRLYLQELLAPVYLALGVLASLHAGVPFAVRNPLAGIWNAFIQGLGVVWWWAPVVLVALHRRGRLDSPATDPSRARVLVPLVRLMLGFGAIALAYSNLKAVLPRVNPMLADGELLRVDVLLGFGRSWNERLGSISAPWFVALMNWSYLSFFFYFPVAMAIALFSADPELLAEVVQGFALVFCLGVVGYYVLPSLGTIYTHPEWHRASEGTRVWRVSRSLLFQQVAIVGRRPVAIQAFFGIGAFPSLHVAHAVFALVVVGRRYPRVLWVGVPAFVLMFVSTLYFGWHYLVDHIGAVVVAWGAVRLVEWDRRRRTGDATAAA